MKAHLIIIDPQNDFMDIPSRQGDPAIGFQVPGGPSFRSALPVPGALADMGRLAALVRRVGDRLDDVHVTLDSHRHIGIERPPFWRDRRSKPPAPFTIITHDDVKNGIWAPRASRYYKHALKYTAALEAAGKYKLMIWPPHCEIGTWGHNVVDVLMAELHRWEEENFASVDYLVKATNFLTEHYGALMAEVPMDDDPATQLSTSIITTLQEADIIGVGGEASSHCVPATVTQIVDNIGDEHLPKIHLLRDCMSPVPQSPGGPDFPAIAEAFFADMARRGLVISDSKTFLA